MLPTNVMTFMKKMVATDEVAPTQNLIDTGGTFGKLRQTLSSSLMTAQDRVNKMSPRSSLVSTDSDCFPKQQKPVHQYKINSFEQDTSASSSSRIETGAIPSRTGACRVCLKSFKADEYSKTCFECQQRVCEDCASYSKLDEEVNASLWSCSICRRKMASRVCFPQDSTDSMLDIPVLEALQRRHSDAKLGASTQALTPIDSAALALPRNSELRRHSDVSPASLKELEKQLKSGSQISTSNIEWRKSGQSIAPSHSSSPPRCDEKEFSVLGPSLSRIPRRGSRVTRQHSYDDDIKSNSSTCFQKIEFSICGAESNVGKKDEELIIPAMPRRKSAYDVFAPVLSQAVSSPGQCFPPDIAALPSNAAFTISRRPSFRTPCSVEDSRQNDESPSPDQKSPVLTVDEDRRMRRRGSQLPDLNALRDRGALPPSVLAAIPPPVAALTGPNIEDLEAPKRQTSMDGEAIKIVVHDVDSGPICSSKRRILLGRDPTDKAHRTRGFGMRVVGGKIGADGRLFAYIVWTVPGGAAEKCGLQQGDKILEWNSMSLIDRSFEEVCSIMDHTGDVVEILVEHATDFRMCDLFEDNLLPCSINGSQTGSRQSGDGVTGLGFIVEPETAADKSPASPTRRRLPKTPM